MLMLYLFDEKTINRDKHATKFKLLHLLYKLQTTILSMK